MAQHLITNSSALLAAAAILLASLMGCVAYITYSLSQAVDAVNDRPHSKALRLQGRASPTKDALATTGINKR